MLLSHEKKFIFLKTTKTAGTSLEFALAPQLDKKAIITPQAGEEYPEQPYARVTWAKPRWILHEAIRAAFAKRTRVFLDHLIRDLLGRKGPVRNDQIAIEFDHISALRTRDFIGEARFNDYFKVAVCRNPYDQIVSLYFWRMYERSKRVPRQPLISFDEWLANSPTDLYLNRSIISIDGELAVDFVIRYEHLNDDLKTLCAKFNFDFEEVVRVMDTKRSKSGQRPKGEAGSRKVIIGPESKAAIDFFMDWDFRTFGYEKVL